MKTCFISVSRVRESGNDEASSRWNVKTGSPAIQGRLCVLSLKRATRIFYQGLILILRHAGLLGGMNRVFAIFLAVTYLAMSVVAHGGLASESSKTGGSENELAQTACLTGQPDTGSSLQKNCKGGKDGKSSVDFSACESFHCAFHLALVEQPFLNFTLSLRQNHTRLADGQFSSTSYEPGEKPPRVSS